MRHSSGHEIGECRACGRMMYSNSVTRSFIREQGGIRLGRDRTCDSCVKWIDRTEGATLEDRIFFLRTGNTRVRGIQRKMERAVMTPPPVVDLRAMPTGSCAGSVNPPPEYWDPIPRPLWGGNPNLLPSVKRAKEVCGRCPVMADCLRDGMKEKKSGVVGGQYLSNGKPVSASYMKKKGKVA